MNTNLTMIERVAHLANLYPSQKYGVTVLKTNTLTTKFDPIDGQLDKRHLTTFCPSSRYVPIFIDSKHVYGLYNCGSYVKIISHRLAKAVGLQILIFNVTFLQAAGNLGHCVGKLRPIPP